MSSNPRSLSDQSRGMTFPNTDRGQCCLTFSALMVTKLSGWSATGCNLLVEDYKLQYVLMIFYVII